MVIVPLFRNVYMMGVYHLYILVLTWCYLFGFFSSSVWNLWVLPQIILQPSFSVIDAKLLIPNGMFISCFLNEVQKSIKNLFLLWPGNRYVSIFDKYCDNIKGMAQFNVFWLTLTLNFFMEWIFYRAIWWLIWDNWAEISLSNW